MTQKTKLSGVFAAALLTTVVAPVTADDQTVRARLSGYQETLLTLNTTASGEFTARIRDGETAIDYELTYRDTGSAVTQAHIHFGRPAITGGIVLFLCTNLTPPSGVPIPPACPAAPATVTGTLTAADVIAVGGQGIDSGTAGFAQILRAIRAGAAYANVHTTGRPSGEIRGSLGHHGRDGHHEH
jgi:hypothetical protein